MNITNFETLLMAAKQQPEPQRLLFVFLKAEMPEDATEEEVGCGAGFPSLALRCRLAERARSFFREEALGLASAVAGEG